MKSHRPRTFRRDRFARRLATRLCACVHKCVCVCVCVCVCARVRIIQTYTHNIPQKPLRTSSRHSFTCVCMCVCSCVRVCVYVCEPQRQMPTICSRDHFARRLATRVCVCVCVCARVRVYTVKVPYILSQEHHILPKEP